MQKQIVVFTLTGITDFWHSYPDLGATNFERQRFAIEWHKKVYGEEILLPNTPVMLEHS